MHDELPIAPLYFYVGLNYYNPEKIKGIHSNIIDVHAYNTIYRVAQR